MPLVRLINSSRKYEKCFFLEENCLDIHNEIVKYDTEIFLNSYQIHALLFCLTPYLGNLLKEESGKIHGKIKQSYINAGYLKKDFQDLVFLCNPQNFEIDYIGINIKINSGINFFEKKEEAGTKLGNMEIVYVMNDKTIEANKRPRLSLNIHVLTPPNNERIESTFKSIQDGFLKFGIKQQAMENILGNLHLSGNFSSDGYSVAGESYETYETYKKYIENFKKEDQKAVSDTESLYTHGIFGGNSSSKYIAASPTKKDPATPNSSPKEQEKDYEENEAFEI